MNERLGAYLKRIRKEKKYTLRAVEANTGISNSYLSQVENDKIRKPAPIFLNKLSRFYDISYEKLLNLAGYPVPKKDVKTQLEPEYRLQSRIAQLTEEEKELVEDYVEFLRSRRRRK